jgi:membrane glycosyltransferase
LPFENYAWRWFGIGGTAQSAMLVILVLALLFLPKLLALARALGSRAVRRSFGGALPVTLGVLAESFLSMLLAPCIMAAHTVMVGSIVLGRAVGWSAQTRDADGTSWSDALRIHAFPTLLGTGWAVLAWKISPEFATWMSPILIGLILSIPISVWTSRSRYGRTLASAGLLSTPEELDPPEVIRVAAAAKAAIDPVLDASRNARSGVIAAVVDPYVNGVHLSLLEPGESHADDDALAERCLVDGPASLSKDELTRLLYLVPAMLMMHRAVWLRPADAIHSVWAHAVESYRRPTAAADAA